MVKRISHEIFRKKPAIESSTEAYYYCSCHRILPLKRSAFIRKEFITHESASRQASDSLMHNNNAWNARGRRGLRVKLGVIIKNGTTCALPRSFSPKLPLMKGKMACTVISGNQVTWLWALWLWEIDYYLSCILHCHRHTPCSTALITG